VTKTLDGRRQEDVIIPVRFVPLTREKE